MKPLWFKAKNYDWGWYPFGLGPIILIVFGLVVMSMFTKVRVNTSVSGWHFRPEHWSGTITVVGDTRFMPWVSLTIAPGAKILFQKNPDIPNTNWTEFADAYITEHNDPTGRAGYNQSHFDLAARIQANGTPSEPIIFTSAQTKPEYADWDQLVLFPGSKLDYVELAYAHNGVYVGTADFPFFNNKNVTAITNSKLHDSLWSCIDVWSANTIIKNNEIYHCWHQGIGVKGQGTNLITNNQIHDAQLSINCENGAKPDINHNYFAAAPLDSDCPAGPGNQDIGRVADTAGGTYQGKLIYPSNN